MANSKRFRTLVLDAVDRRGRPVIGVVFVTEVDGKVGPGIEKRDAGPVPIKISAENQPVTVEARLSGWPNVRVQLAVGAPGYTFTFAGAGEPTVLIVCALKIETEAVLATFDWHSDGVLAGPPGDPLQYWIGHYGKVANGDVVRQVRLTSSGMGNNSSAIVATHALRSFHSALEHVLMVGIAGGCPNARRVDEHVRLGDVVVGTKGVVQYDYVKRKVADVECRGIPQRPSRALVDASNALEIKRLGAPAKASWVRWILQGADADPGFQRPKKDLLHHGKRVVAHPTDPRRRMKVPLVHHGVIGSANILLKDPKLRDKVRDQFSVRAIEMEGSGIMDAGWAMDKDIMVVRGVCDYCDDHKSDTWQRYAALAAAAYTRGLIEALPEDWFP